MVYSRGCEALDNALGFLFDNHQEASLPQCLVGVGWMTPQSAPVRCQDDGIDPCVNRQ